MQSKLLFSVFAVCTQGAPLFSTNRAQSPLGSSFGVPGLPATYDYIVVGGGTAGLTLATRLAEQQTGKVAVVEAGGFYEIDNGNISQVPATDGFFAGKAKDDWQPLIDWGYITTPQAGAYGEEIHYARGRCLGGSSARNFMGYQRATKGSYQSWADAVEDQSYTFDQLLPFFEKSLKFTPPNNELRFANVTTEYDASVLGDGSGPLSLSFPNYVQAFGTWVTQGLKALGLPIVKGFQSGYLSGQSYAMFTINATTMIRDSSETSFLSRGLDYSNYYVYQSTMAKQIIFDANRKATGVLVDTSGATYVLSATKEVILTAGVFGSPQLLMVSGVGPAAALQQHDIPVIANRPGVGQNMEDHVFFGPSYRVNAPTFSAFSDPTFVAQQTREFQENAAGFFTNPTADVMAWENVPESLRSTLSSSTLDALTSYPDDWPDLEYFSLGAYLGYQQNLALGDPRDGYNYASLAIALIKPRSKGNLTIASADTAVSAVINPNWLTDPADMEVAIAGFKRGREFWQSSAMQPFVIGEEAFPGPQVQTDAEIEDAIRRNFNTIYHASSTCAMGREDDEMAVVDSHARVFGVQGLRVVDASVFPFLPPGHPQATIYALAEKLACDISGGCGVAGGPEVKVQNYAWNDRLSSL